MHLFFPGGGKGLGVASETVSGLARLSIACVWGD